MLKIRQASLRTRPPMSESGSMSPACPALQIVARNAAGDTVYLYSDPYECQCVYVGGANEYAELQRLRAQRIADHEKAVQQIQAESDSQARRRVENQKGLQVKP